jgi:tetratricopeptide (TPR) repeat protein
MIVQALKLKPDNGYILDSMGWVLFKKGKVAGALQYLKKALEYLPEDAGILEHLGDAYLETGKREEALEHYRRALEKQPDNNLLIRKIDSLKQTK